MKKTLYITQETQDRLASLGGPTPSENLRRAVALAEFADELAECLGLILPDAIEPSADRRARHALNQYDAAKAREAKQ